MRGVGWKTYMDQECHDKPGQGKGQGILVWLIFAPIIYIVSVGPVGALTKNSPNPTYRLVCAFYHPLVWLCDHTLLKQPIEVYANLWGVH